MPPVREPSARKRPYQVAVASRLVPQVKAYEPRHKGCPAIAFL